jgi:hypothetical protein
MLSHHIDLERRYPSLEGKGHPLAGQHPPVNRYPEEVSCPQLKEKDESLQLWTSAPRLSKPELSSKLANLRTVTTTKVSTVQHGGSTISHITFSDDCVGTLRSNGRVSNYICFVFL